MFLKLAVGRRYHKLPDMVSAQTKNLAPSQHHVGDTCIYRIILNLVSQCHTAGVAVYG